MSAEIMRPDVPLTPVYPKACMATAGLTEFLRSLSHMSLTLSSASGRLSIGYEGLLPDLDRAIAAGLLPSMGFLSMLDSGPAFWYCVAAGLRLGTVPTQR